ncbi:MAG: iron permease FTR1, partial [Schwartzia sp.]|nr:iron permease FTR1 [Schwartzia sp. (in: firmicutes)]
PFFLVTSALMFLLAVTFTGSGIEELQEGEVISMTRIEGFPTIDVLGIYPTYETLIPQLILIAIAVIMVLYKKRQSAGGSVV